MKVNNVYTLLILFALGIFVSSYSYKIGIGSLSNPGPGLFPFLLGILLFLLSLYKMNKEIRNRTGWETGHNALIFRKLIALISILLFYGLFLQTLGYTLTTFITLSLLFKTAGYKYWRRIIIYAICIVFIIRFIFTSLGVRFPQGIF
jgi:putative tricarboxylic transport membrane protein